MLCFLIYRYNLRSRDILNLPEVFLELGTQGQESRTGGLGQQSGQLINETASKSCRGWTWRHLCEFLSALWPGMLRIKVWSKGDCSISSTPPVPGHSEACLAQHFCLLGCPTGQLLASRDTQPSGKLEEVLNDCTYSSLGPARTVSGRAHLVICTVSLTSPSFRKRFYL